MIEEIIKKIYDSSINGDIVRGFTKNTALFLLINALDKTLSDIMIEMLNHGAFQNFGRIQSQIRHSFRVLLKIIFKYCKDGPLDLEMDSDSFRLFSDELGRLIDFNFMRNILERYKLGYFMVKKTTDDTIELCRSKDSRSAKYDIYGRLVQMLDEEPTSVEAEKTRFAKHNEIMNPEIIRSIKKKGKFHTYDYFFKNTYKIAYDSILCDADITGDYQFSSFTLGEYRQIYAYILARAMNRLAYYNFLKIRKKENFDIEYCPSFKMDYDEFIEEISSYLFMDENKVIEIIDYLSYDSSFHEDKIAIYQPLIRIDNMITFSTWLVVWELAQNKFLYVLNKKNENQEVFSRIAKDKEVVMTEESINMMAGYGWIINKNTTLKIMSVVRAEFDISVFEETSGILLLIELKWLNQVDNERESFYQDIKLDSFCEDRKNKEKLVICNIEDYVKQNKIAIRCADIKRIASVIVNKNNIGNTKINDVIPIIDWYMFERLLKSSKGSLINLIEEIETGRYLDFLNERTQQSETYEFSGIKMIVSYE